MGFGMVIPLSPILARDFGADGLQVGLLISAYSIVQFLCAPYWGRLSDIFGRKFMLLIGLLGVGFSHMWFAFSDDLFNLFISRSLAGFFGANIVIAMAYIADITQPEERSKNLGLIGMAFGLGFTVGPALGFLFIYIGKQMGSVPPFGESFAAFGAALVCFLNFIMSFILLKDSHFVQKQIKQSTSSYLSGFKTPNLFKRPSLSFIWKALKEPQLGKVIFMSFILWIGIAKIEPVLILLVQDDFGWQKSTAYWSFAYIGLLMAFSQGYLVRKLIPRYGEKIINKYGLLLFSIGLFFIGCSPMELSLPISMVLLASGVTLFGIGYSLASTSLSGALSLLSPKQHQGSIFGINQSFTSLARITGPIIGGLVYRDLSHESPFLLAGVMGLGALGLAIWMGDQFPIIGKTKQSKTKEDLFNSIDKEQLKNLIEKRIHFSFFCIEDLDVMQQSFITNLKSYLEFKNEEEVLQSLQDKEKNQPIVLLCKTGFVSEQLSKKLRDEGYINAYYLEKGLKGM